MTTPTPEDRQVRPPVTATPRELMDWAEEIDIELTILKHVDNKLFPGEDSALAREIEKLRGRAVFLRRMAAAGLELIEKRKGT